MNIIQVTRSICSIEHTRLFEIVDKYSAYISTGLFSTSLMSDYILHQELKFSVFNFALANLTALSLFHKVILRYIHSWVDPVEDTRSMTSEPLNQSNVSMLDTGIIISHYTFRFLNQYDIETDLARLTKLGCEAFGGYSKYSYEDRKAFYRRWYERNRKVFVLIFNNTGKAIGYFCLLPMKEYHSNKHYRGCESQFTLDSKYICETDEKTNLIYLQAVAIQKDAREVCLPFAHRLCQSLIKTWMLDDENLTLYSEQFSPEGERLLKRRGFFTHKKSADNHPIYELHFSGERGPKEGEDKNFENYLEFKASIISAHTVQDLDGQYS